jgi:hypothetical protein
MKFTPSVLKSDILSNLDLNVLTISADMDQSEIEELIKEQLGSTCSTAAEVVYYHHAWEVVAGSDWNDYEAEDVDFSNCESSLECVMAEANAVTKNAYNSLVGEIAFELAQEIETFNEAATNEGFEGDVNITSGSTFGWSVHQREDEHGIAYYYNLESEKGLTALEVALSSNNHISVCFKK